MGTVLFDNYPEALAALAAKLDAREFAPDRYYIVLTPDRYTQSVEAALFSRRGALDLEVLTLSRLCRRVIGDRKTLSREGGVMITAQAIAAVKNELTYYKRAARFNDFAREAYAAILQVGASDANLDDVPSSGAVASKLNDIKLIKNMYDSIRADRLDSPDRLTALISACDSEFIKNAEFFAIGFKVGDFDTTRLNRRVFSAIAANARAFTEYAVRPIDGAARRGSMTLFCAPDRISEYKEVAACIREYIDMPPRGERRKYSDIAVVCPEPRALKRILREYGIPVYSDEKKALFDTPPLGALDLIYKLKNSADGETLVALCKNPFSGVDGEIAEKLQNHISSRGITYGVFDDGKIKDDDAMIAVARAKALTESFRGKKFSDAVRATLEFGNFEDIQAKLFKDGTDMTAPILSLAALLDEFGSADGDFDADADIFFSAARAVEVKSLPRSQDSVTVTMPQSLRLTACKMLYVTDFNDGLLPSVTNDSALLGDKELIALKKQGCIIEPTALDQNRREKEELRAVILNARNAVCMYTTGGRAQPSSLIFELAHSLERITGVGMNSALAMSGVKTGDKRTDTVILEKYACTAGAAREIAARKQSPFALSLFEAVGDGNAVAAPYERSIGEIEKNTLSVSELTHWFDCPYKRFLSDGIGLKERRRGKLDAPDFGIIVHDFMEKFIKYGNYDCSREAVGRIVKQVIDEKDISVEPNECERLIDDAVDFAETNVKILNAGMYAPSSTEKPFEKRISFGKNKTKFAGFIDRVDVCGNNARVIDYKTGSKDFSKKKCLNGRDMQLPLYAHAVEANGYNVTGMFYVNLSPKFDDKKKPMSGRMIKDTDVLFEYDRSLADGVGACGKASSELFSASVGTDSKDGTLKIGGRESTTIEKGEFDALIDICVKNANIAADEISSGYIERSPADGACERCPYKGVCGGNAKTRE